jgi:Na+/melibiose symporter-like transporter
VSVVGGLIGTLRPSYLPVLVTYFAYGASTITGVALLYFQKDVLGLTPAEVAHVAFWIGLPWSMKMVAGVASDRYPILGGRRRPYLLLGALLSVLGYAALATVVETKAGYLAATVVVAIGFMVQDVVADALSVEVVETDAEVGQIQTLGRMALLVGTISVGYLSGVLARAVGPRGVFAIAMALPALVAATGLAVRVHGRPAPRPERDPLGGGKAPLVLGVGLGYAALGVVLEALEVAWGQELVLLVSAALIALLLSRVGVSRAVAVAALVIFLFRATPSVGQGYSYWAIDRLGFDQRFLGLLAQVSSVLSLAGLLLFRRPLTERPVSVTLTWVMLAGAVLYLPNIGLFYGLHDWLGVSARTLAFIDTTISAPLTQLTMVPMLILIARTAPRGAEATMFAIMASLMNLALSASELFTRYLNTAYSVTQADYSRLGALMITVLGLGLVPLLALPLLRRQERALRQPPPVREAA